MPPKFDFNKIKFATERPTFEKAVDLYESGKIKNFKEGISAYSAIVEGGKNYNVSIEARRFGLGYCDCYMGQNDYLCKHIVALSIYAVLGGKPIMPEDKKLNSEPQCCGKLGELSKMELAEVKKSISNAIKYIKSYNGPSRTWFTYQASLSEGCNRLSAIVSGLPVSAQITELIIKMLLRLDKKLCKGVDDSDGTVGGFMQECVEILKEFSQLDKKCINTFELLCKQSTCFGWEDPLVRMYDENKAE
ncbi:MAG: SWIM zinc finger family protein [bacterium]|nr:SWIM zinc finger family protein [bacterium]